jgi:adenosine deaminase
MKATVNSDDPAYFRAYMNDNFIALQEEGDFSREEILQLCDNSFDVSWMSDARKKTYREKLASYAAASG